jgi:hypothetical protein
MVYRHRGSTGLADAAPEGEAVMAVTARLFSRVFLAAFNKEIDLIDDNIACTLHTVALVPDQDAHDYVNDLSGEVAASGGYTTGGQYLLNDTLTYTPATNVVMYDADDVVWAGSTITARTAVLSDRTPGTAATQPLICYQQSDVDIVSSGGEFRVQWNASGIFSISVA